MAESKSLNIFNVWFWHIRNIPLGVTVEGMIVVCSLDLSLVEISGFCKRLETMLVKSFGDPYLHCTLSILYTVACRYISAAKYTIALQSENPHSLLRVLQVTRIAGRM